MNLRCMILVYTIHCMWNSLLLKSQVLIKKKVQNLNIKRLTLHVEIVFNEENDNIIRIKT